METIEHIQSTTYDGMLITITVNGVPLNLTGATITAVFESSCGRKAFTIGDGITDVVVLAGSFMLLEDTFIDWTKATWLLTVTIVLGGGSIKKYIYKNVEFIVL